MDIDAGECIKKMQTAGDWREKREAIIELGYFKEPVEQKSSVIRALLRQLRDPMPEIQQAAIISLRRLGASEAVAELKKPRYVSSPDMNVRWATVSALGALGDYGVIDTLLAAVDDTEWLVRNEALSAIRQKVSDIVSLDDARLARVLLGMLTLEDQQIVELAASGLVQMGARGLDLVVENLSSQNERVRRNAALILGDMRNPKLVPSLIPSLSDPSPQVRSRAAQALGQIGDPHAIEALVKALGDSSEEAQKDITEALRTFGSVATQPLLHALDHEMNKNALRAIILALGNTADDQALPGIAKYLRSSYFAVRVAAIEALRPFGTRAIPHLLGMLEVNESDIKTLLSDASDAKNPAAQIRAINALGSLEDHRAVCLLKDLVEGDNREVGEAAQDALVLIGTAAWGRCGALILLGEIGDSSVRPHIEKSLADDSANARLEAVRALGKLGGRKAIPPLGRTALNDPDPYIRTEALRTLRWLGISSKRVVDVGLAALEDPEWQVRNQAARLLGNFQEERSIAPLVRALSHNNWGVRQSAEDALQSFGKKAVPALIEALRTDDWVVRLRASRALGEIGDRRAVEPLEQTIAKEKTHPKALEFEEQALEKIRQAG